MPVNKKCTNPACRRVFSTLDGRTACPRCGREYRITRQGLTVDRYTKPVQRERGFGRVACSLRSGRWHVWIGPAVQADSPAVNRSRCTCVLTVSRLPDAGKLRCVKALRGGEGFLRLRDAKGVIDALLTAPAVLHTDAETARSIVDSGLFPIKRGSRTR